jgi:hypothetical protein
VNKRTFTIYEYETIVTKYVVEVDDYDAIDPEQYVDKMETTDGWVLDKGKTVSTELSGREVWDTETGQLLLQY